MLRINVESKDGKLGKAEISCAGGIKEIIAETAIAISKIREGIVEGSGETAGVLLSIALAPVLLGKEAKETLGDDFDIIKEFIPDLKEDDDK